MRPQLDRALVLSGYAACAFGLSVLACKPPSSSKESAPHAPVTIEDFNGKIIVITNGDYNMYSPRKAIDAGEDPVLVRRTDSGKDSAKWVFHYQSGNGLERKYRVQNKETDACLYARHDHIAGEIHQHSCNDSARLLWLLVPLSDASYYIISVANGQAAYNRDGSNKLAQHPPNESTRVRWKLGEVKSP